MIHLKYSKEYTDAFHSPGLEPWICGILAQCKPKSVLDIGCGLGFWGLVLKGLLGVPHVVGVDVDRTKVEFAKRLNVYDELYVSDIRTFNYPEPFDSVISIDALHGILDRELLRKLEDLTKRGGLIILSLPTLPKSITVNVMVQRGYVLYRYFLRGFILVRIDKAEVRTTPSGPWRALGH